MLKNEFDHSQITPVHKYFESQIKLRTTQPLETRQSCLDLDYPADEILNTECTSQITTYKTFKDNPLVSFNVNKQIGNRNPPDPCP